MKHSANILAAPMPRTLLPLLPLDRSFKEQRNWSSHAFICNLIGEPSTIGWLSLPAQVGSESLPA